MEKQSLIPFENKAIRKIWYNDEWYFSVIDVMAALTDSPNPNVYWSALKKREKDLFTFCKKVKLLGQDGKSYPSDCANTDGILRIVMSVPSPRAEPLKLWLAQVGRERLEETENPELAYDRMRALYKAKGYTDEWVKSRIQTIETRKQLTDEWKNRGVKEGQEYAILTSEIAKATFGLTPSEHKTLKNLEKQNLRDHMTPLELIFTALGEEITRNIAVADDAQGFGENRDSALQGGKLAGDARERVEKDKRVKVVSAQNFLNQIEDAEKQNLLPENEQKEERAQGNLFL